MKRKLTKTEKFLLIAIALSGSLYLYFYKIYDPKMNDYRDMQNEIATLQEEIAGLGESPSIKGITDMLNEEKRIEQELLIQYQEVLSSKKAVTKSAVSEVLSEIIGNSSDSGLKLKEQLLKLPDAEEDTLSEENTSESEKNTSEEKNGAGFFDWHEYKMVFEGDLSGLIRFVKGLKEMKQSTVIEHIEINAVEETNKYEITMRILI